jgi:hypothetical protein
VLTRDGRITPDEVVATVKSMMNAKIADPLDEEGQELLAKVSADLAAKYDGDGDGFIDKAEAAAAWAKYEKGQGAGGGDNDREL